MVSGEAAGRFSHPPRPSESGRGVVTRPEPAPRGLAPRGWGVCCVRPPRVLVACPRQPVPDGDGGTEPEAGVHRRLANKKVPVPARESGCPRESWFRGKVSTQPGARPLGVLMGHPGGMSGRPRGQAWKTQFQKHPRGLLSRHLLVRAVTWRGGTPLLTSQRGPAPDACCLHPRRRRPRGGPSWRVARRRRSTRVCSEWNGTIARGRGAGLAAGAGGIFMLPPQTGGKRRPRMGHETPAWPGTLAPRVCLTAWCSAAHGREPGQLGALGEATSQRSGSWGHLLV